jgi:hypothetical protein
MFEQVNERWLEENRPRSKFPYECALNCQMRADHRYDVLIGGLKLHFCSREHMLEHFEGKKEDKKSGRPKGAMNKVYYDR